MFDNIYTEPLESCYGCEGTGNQNHGRPLFHRKGPSPCSCIMRNACSECGEDTPVEREEPGQVIHCNACGWYFLLAEAIGGHDNATPAENQTLNEMAEELAKRLGRIEE